MTQTDINDLALDEETITIDDVITTYMLKTCLLFLCEENIPNRGALMRDELMWAEMIYEKLKQFVTNRKLPTYYGDGVLFQCGDHADDDRVDRVCCQKRALILRLCDVILTFIKHNRSELQATHSIDWQAAYEKILTQRRNRKAINEDNASAELRTH